MLRFNKTHTEGLYLKLRDILKYLVPVFHVILLLLLHGLSPRANYTDRANAACRRSDCQLFVDRGCHVVSVTDPYSRILGFID
jgi:hypothetical protein